MPIRHMSDIVRRKPVMLQYDVTAREACAVMRNERIGAILVAWRATRGGVGGPPAT